jgi:hypothetical protein
MEYMLFVGDSTVTCISTLTGALTLTGSFLRPARISAVVAGVVFLSRYKSPFFHLVTQLLNHATGYSKYKT